MAENNNQSYKTKQNIFQEFYHTCLGKIIILFAALFVIFLLAVLTRPNRQQMEKEMADNIIECLQDNDSIKGDGIDDFVNNCINTFSSADTTEISKEVIDAYNKHNRVEIYEHSSFATAYIFNNIHPSGERIGIGVFGLVIPTIKYKDMVLFINPIRKYKQKLLPTPNVSDDDLGENANIHEYHYLGDPDQ